MTASVFANYLQTIPDGVGQAQGLVYLIGKKVPLKLEKGLYVATSASVDHV
jgi:hypothetical protein